MNPLRCGNTPRFAKTIRTLPLLKLAWLLTLLCLPACTTHTVSIRSDPPGARVYDTVRGELGHTSISRPLLQEVPYGARLDLYFSQEGYEPKFVMLNRIRGDHDVLAVLHPVTTRLWIGTIPAGATVSFQDGWGQPVKLRNPGNSEEEVVFSSQAFMVPSDWTQVSVTLSKPGYETLRRDIRVQPGRENRHSFELVPQRTMLSITTDPEGAEVYERRLNLLGTTPIQDLYLPYEKLRRLHPHPQSTLNLILTISKPGYRSVEKIHTIDLFKSNAPLDVKLESEP